MRIFPPSSGWIGMRLKIAKTTLRMMKGYRKPAIKGIGKKGVDAMRTTIPNIIAKAKFDKGPANEINAASLLGFLRLNGSNRTGFAQPKGITGIPIDLIITNTKRRVVPMGS